MTENQKLRELFETYMTDGGKWSAAINKGPTGSYLLLRTATAWGDWKACAEALTMPTNDHSGDAANMVPPADHIEDSLAMVQAAASAIYYNASLGDFSLHHPDDLDGWVVYVPQPAAPVDERKLPPLPAAGIPDDQLQLDVGDLYTAKQMRDYARTALHSGADAKDAERYRWLADCNNFYEAIKLIADGSLTETALGAAIDAAITSARGA